MYDRWTCRHEAAHAVVGAVLGVWNVARVNDDGGGVTRYAGGGLVGLSAEDRAVIALAGNVGETILIDGNLGRAIRDTQAAAGGDGDLLAAAVRDGASVRDATLRARSILVQHRDEWDRLSAALQRDGIGHVRVANVYTSRAVALKRGRVAGPAELRELASRAKGEGHASLARLLEASLARAERGAPSRIIEQRLGV